MKPYYEHDGITIYHGDCREVLPTLGEKVVTIADPPYGNGTPYASYEDTPDALAILTSQWVPLALSVSVRTVITPGIGNIWLYPRPTWTMAWMTPAGSGSGPWGFCCWQPILVYGKCPYLQSG